MGKIRVVFVAVCTCIFLTNEASQTESTRGRNGHYQVGSNGDNGSINRVVRSAQPQIIFNDSEVVVNQGESLNLTCGVDGEYTHCVWRHGDDIHQIRDVSMGIEAGISVPDDKTDNQCGIVVDSVKIKDHGEWTCNVLKNKTRILTGSKKVVVTIQPNEPHIEFQSSRSNVGTTENTHVRCSVAEARPAVSMKWYLGDEDITEMSEKVKIPVDDKDTYNSTSTLTRRFLPEDDGKTLMCSIAHTTLTYGANASVPVNVTFKPIEKNTTTFYQIQLGSNYEVKFNIYCNPKPLNATWKFGENLESPEGSLIIPETRGRYNTSLEELGNNTHTVKLLIEEFTLDDSKKNYSLLVRNEVGETEYQIRLSVEGPDSRSFSWRAVIGVIFGAVAIGTIAACMVKNSKKISSLQEQLAASRQQI